MHASNDAQEKSFYAPMAACIENSVMAALMQQAAISTPLVLW